MFGILAIFIACTMWALDTLIRYPLLQGGTPAVHIVFYEHLILCLLILPWLWHRQQLSALRQPTLWTSFLIVGGLGSAIGTLAFTQAFAYINPTVVILLQKLQPLVASFAARWILQEHGGPRFWLYAILGLTGTLLLMGGDLKALGSAATWQGYGSAQTTAMGYSYTLLAAIAWGLATVLGKRLLNSGLSVVQTMGGRFIAALLVLLPLALILPAPSLSSISSETLGKVAILALLAGVIGMGFYYYGLRQVPAHVATLAELFFPVAAIIINWVSFDAVLTVWQLVGAGVLTLAALLAQRDSKAATCAAHTAH